MSRMKYLHDRLGISIDGELPGDDLRSRHVNCWNTLAKHFSFLEESVFGKTISSDPAVISMGERRWARLYRSATAPSLF